MNSLLKLLWLSGVLIALPFSPGQADWMDEQLKKALPGTVPGWELQKKGSSSFGLQPRAFGYWRRGKSDHLVLLIAHPDVSERDAAAFAQSNKHKHWEPSKRGPDWKPQKTENRILFTKPSGRRFRAVLLWRGKDPAAARALLSKLDLVFLDKLVGLPRKGETIHVPYNATVGARLLMGALPKVAGDWKRVHAANREHREKSYAMGFYKQANGTAMFLALGTAKRDFLRDYALRILRKKKLVGRSGSMEYASNSWQNSAYPGRVHFVVAWFGGDRTAAEQVLDKVDLRRVTAYLRAPWHK